MKIGIIVQTRMGSTRLPGKVLMKADERDMMLDYSINQLKHCKNSDELIIATTNLERDDVIEQHCKNLHVDVFRGDEKDVLMAFTTSGNSKNILEAINAAKKKSIKVLLVTGGNGGKAQNLIGPDDVSIIIPSNRTSRIQEMTLIVIHSICECIDKHYQNK